MPRRITHRDRGWHPPARRDAGLGHAGRPAAVSGDQVVGGLADALDAAQGGHQVLAGADRDILPQFENTQDEPGLSTDFAHTAPSFLLVFDGVFWPSVKEL